MKREEFLRQFAKELTLSEFNDKPYRDLPKEAIETAKNNNIVIVYGQSDDLLEFDGALYDEFGCYEGGTFYFDKDGNNVKEMTRNIIQAIWCGDNTEWTWSYKTTIPHENFEMMDDGEKYCQGFVFYKDELKGE